MSRSSPSRFRAAGAIGWSAALHTLVVVTAAVLGAFAGPQRRPFLVVDFSIEEKGSSASASLQHDAPPPSRSALQRRETAAEGRHDTEEMLPAATTPPQPDRGPAEDRAAAPLSSPAALRAAASPLAAPEQESAGIRGIHRSPGEGTTTAPAAGESNTESSPDGLRKRYLKEHFAFIRERVVRNIAYPPLARKRGWEGRVLLSFCVMYDGSVSAITILRSSGKELLDDCAVEAVRKSMPFPRPPVEAEVILPVVFHLK